MSVAQTVSARPVEAAGMEVLDSGKYIPPPRRRQMEEERKKRETNPGAPLSSTQPAYEHQPSSLLSCGSFASSPSFGVIAERWKSLNIEDGWDGQPTLGKSNSWAGSRHPQQSQTGTRWDIRDGRRWNPENAEEIFKKDKDKSTGINFVKYDSTPVELSGNGCKEIEPLSSFVETRGVHPLLMENIIKVEYEKPTPVQKYSIPAILTGRDLMGCAQTGSGKTAAFLFPIITKMLSLGPPPDVSKPHGRMRTPAHPIALILSPARELAIQICEESRKYAFRTGIRSVVVYGGSEVKAQLYDLENGCDICVATPGRLSDLMTRGKVFLRFFVLDEADRMLDMGFSPQIYSIVTDHDMPTSIGGRQTVMFSATFPKPIQELASEFLRDYLFLTVGRVGSTNDFIEQYLLYAEESTKPKKLLKLLEETSGLVLVFVETRKKADLIEGFLLSCDLPAVSIHGDKSQSERESALHRFRNGKRSILVATDVAARGLDIHNIEHVINCDLPARIEDYVHRIGRTGRAGNRGKATSFVNEGNRGVLRELLSLLEEAGQTVPEWFFEMVRQCTSAYRGGFSGSGSTFGRRGGAPSRSGSGFGSRDMRNSASAGYLKSAQSGASKFSDGSNSGSLEINRVPSRAPATLPEEDDEDGW